LRCSDELCTGNHDDRKYATLCPATKRRKSLSSRKYYAANKEAMRDKAQGYRTTANYMLAQLRYGASRITEGDWMRELTELEMAKKEALDTVKGLIRMRHRQAANREINEALPRIELEIERAFQAGKAYTLDPRKVLSGGE